MNIDIFHFIGVLVNYAKLKIFAYQEYFLTTLGVKAFKNY